MTSISDDFERIRIFYNSLVHTHSYSPQGLDYSSWENQKLRFDVIAGVADVSGLSVLDVGCGFGDFYDYTKSRFPSSRYLGVDLSDEMVAMAQRRHPDGRFMRANILADDIERHGIVVANGIFYLLGNDAWSHMQRIISRLYELAEVAVAFSSLSSRADQGAEGEFRAEPGRTLEFCLGLTPRVVLRHDYHVGDFMVFMYRP